MGEGLANRTRRTFVLTAVVALAATLIGAAPAAAQPEHSDAVRVWNLYATDALINATGAVPTPGAGQAPPVSQLHLAMVQGAVYDAVNAIVGGYQPYLPDLPTASPSASQEAAVATAAHHVLVGLENDDVLLLPDAVRVRLDGLYADALAGILDGDAKTEGVAAGAAAATAMLAARTDDGRFAAFPWQEGAEAGEWRPTPPGFGNDLAWVGQVEPFTLESTSQLRTKGPNAVTSGAYAKEYNEVKDLGAAGSPRTPEQNVVVQLYTANPIELFNRTFRVVSEAHGLTLAEEARLFAMLNVATADSVISCFNDKAFWNYWRPVTAIREGENDGNHKTAGDPEWTPLLTTPPYSDHPSGYNCVSAAYMHAAGAFFGTDKVDFSVIRPIAGMPAVELHYTRFTDLVDDTIDARVWQGLHFREADVQGAGIGKDAARWLAKHFFQPVK